MGWVGREASAYQEGHARALDVSARANAGASSRAHAPPHLANGTVAALCPPFPPPPPAPRSLPHPNLVVGRPRHDRLHVALQALEQRRERARQHARLLPRALNCVRLAGSGDAVGQHHAVVGGVAQQVANLGQGRVAGGWCVARGFNEQGELDQMSPACLPAALSHTTATAFARCGACLALGAARQPCSLGSLHPPGTPAGTHQRRGSRLIVLILRRVAVKHASEGVGLPTVAALVGLAALGRRDGDGVARRRVHAVLARQVGSRGALWRGRARGHRRPDADKHLPRGGRGGEGWVHSVKQAQAWHAARVKSCHDEKACRRASTLQPSGSASAAQCPVCAAQLARWRVLTQECGQGACLQFLQL